MYPYVLTGSAVTLTLGDGQPFTMGSNHKLFDRMLAALRAKDVNEIDSIVKLAKKVTEFTAGKVTVRSGIVYYGDEAMSHVVADKILAFIGEGLDPKPLMRFLERLMKNPSYQSRQELYLFLETCNHTITEDGRFLAYKWVRDDYFDTHSATYKNVPGATIEMPRHKVNDDRWQTCSAGLHVCSKYYTPFGPRLMLVAVDPADVVSVPNDYNNAKMRVCRYQVIKELDPKEFNRGLERETLYQDDDFNQFSQVEDEDSGAEEGADAEEEIDAFVEQVADETTDNLPPAVANALVTTLDKLSDALKDRQ